MGKADASFAIGSLVVTPLKLGFALVVLAIVAYAAFIVGGRLGVGPLAPPKDPDAARSGPPPASPAPDGWVRLGWGLGFPAAGWRQAAQVLLPLALGLFALRGRRPQRCAAA